jgi:hypothetical protein
MLNKTLKEFIQSIDPSMFIEPPTMDTVGKPLPSPRTWMIVNNIMNMKLPLSAKKEMIIGTIGKKVGKMLVSHMLDSQVSFVDILNGNYEDYTVLTTKNLSTIVHDIIDYTSKHNKEDFDIDGFHPKHFNCFVTYLKDNYPYICAELTIDSLMHNNELLKKLITLYETCYNINLAQDICNRM